MRGGCRPRAETTRDIEGTGPHHEHGADQCDGPAGTPPARGDEASAGDDAGHPDQDDVPDEPRTRDGDCQGHLPACPGDAGTCRHRARPEASGGDRHASRELGRGDGLPADGFGQGPVPRRAGTVGILRRHARAAPGLHRPGQAPVDPQHPDHAPAADRGDGPPDPARRPSRPPRSRGLLGPVDPDVRTARQREIVHLERHPRCDRRQDLHPPRARILGPGDHGLRPDRSLRGRTADRRSRLAPPHIEQVRHALRARASGPRSSPGAN